MLNTALWPSNVIDATILFEPALLVDLEEAEPTAVATATCGTQPSPSPKPYRYGKHKRMAEQIRQRWNQSHPFDPMP